MRTIAVVEIVSAVFLGEFLIGMVFEKDTSRSNRCLMRCLMTMFLALIIDAMTYIFDGTEYPFMLLYIVNLMAFLAACINAMVFTFYCAVLYNEKVKMNPWIFRSAEIIEFVWMIAILYEFTFGPFALNVYSRSNLPFRTPIHIYVISIFVMMYLFVVAFVFRHKAGNKLVFLLCLFNISQIVGAMLSYFTGNDYSFVLGTYMLMLVAEFVQRQEAKMRVEASNKAKTEFLFNMSHDIRTPMNAMIGFTEKAIRHKNDPQVLSESLDKIKASSEYLLSLVNNILEMARIESGKLEIKEELHYSEDGSNALIDVFGAEATGKNITLHTTYNTKDKYLWMDETRTNQIIANLLSNAVKYTHPGGEIWYSVEQAPCEKEGYVRYVSVVRDNGQGMSKEFLEKIFDSFERESSARNTREQGTGLGMAIVKKIVDEMGGNIEVHSELGKGTVVSVSIDYRLASSEEIEQYVAQKNRVREKTKLSFEGKRILLVEDNELNREIASDILIENNILVEEAENGQVAVDLLKEKGPGYYDYVLMDIQMPIMDGYEATRTIRKMYPDSKIPIIALSANAFSEDRIASFEAGMDEHVAKPMRIPELFDVLSKF